MGAALWCPNVSKFVFCCPHHHLSQPRLCRIIVGIESVFACARRGIRNISIADLAHALTILINEFYPYPSTFSDELYSLNDVVRQLVFEVIKEEYKKYAPRHTHKYFYERHDEFGSDRKYSRARKYAQYYRDHDDDRIEGDFGIRIPELEALDMSEVRARGHQITKHEYLGLKLEAECVLLKKLHQRQIESSKRVKAAEFKKLFEDYSSQIDKLEPGVNEPEGVICNTYVYYGIETHFLTEFLYRLTLAAEEAGFPKAHPTDRIITVCSITPIVPATSWCPMAYIADFCMIPKWDSFCRPIFLDNDEEWKRKALLVQDCKHIKGFILQRYLEKLIGIAHDCTVADKANFIEENYWIWDNRLWKNPAEYEWTPKRISYYRNLHSAIMRRFPKPHVS